MLVHLAGGSLYEWDSASANDDPGNWQNVLKNVNIILDSLSVRAQQAWRADYLTILGIGQAFIKVMQSMWGSTL